MLNEAFDTGICGPAKSIEEDLGRLNASAPEGFVYGWDCWAALRQRMVYKEALLDRTCFDWDAACVGAELKKNTKQVATSIWTPYWHWITILMDFASYLCHSDRTPGHRLSSNYLFLVRVIFLPDWQPLTVEIRERLIHPPQGCLSSLLAQCSSHFSADIHSHFSIYDLKLFREGGSYVITLQWIEEGRNIIDTILREKVECQVVTNKSAGTNDKAVNIVIHAYALWSSEVVQVLVPYPYNSVNETVDE